MYVRCNYVSLGPDKPGQSTVTTAAPRDRDVTTAAPLTRILLQLCWTTAASARASASSASTTRRSSRPPLPACRACPAWVASPWRSILVKRCWVWKFHKADPNPKMFWLPLSPVILSLVQPRDHDFLFIFFNSKDVWICLDLTHGKGNFHTLACFYQKYQEVKNNHNRRQTKILTNPLSLYCPLGLLILRRIDSSHSRSRLLSRNKSPTGSQNLTFLSI